jgi:hypothetical protein
VEVLGNAGYASPTNASQPLRGPEALRVGRYAMPLDHHLAVAYQVSWEVS